MLPRSPNSTGPQTNLMLANLFLASDFCFVFLSSVKGKVFSMPRYFISPGTQYHLQLRLFGMVVSCLLEVLVNVFV